MYHILIKMVPEKFIFKLPVGLSGKITPSFILPLWQKLISETYLISHFLIYGHLDVLKLRVIPNVSCFENQDG